MSNSEKQQKHLERLKILNTGVKKSKETKHLMSLAKRGKVFTDQHKEKLSIIKQKQIEQRDSDNKLITTHNSISKAANYLNCSIAAISFALRNKTKSQGFYWRYKIEKKQLSYWEILYTRSQLLTFSKEKLERIVEEFLNIIKDTPFPYHETKENLDIVIKKINEFNLGRILKDGVFNNMTSSVGVSYLKALFKNYYHCNYKGGISPIKLWENEGILKKVIEYRVGLNATRETFNLCLHQMIRGISARRSSISIFKPLIAGAIYKYYLGDKINPIVIDPCAGFGGRLLGFKALYPEGTYIGIDPQKETYQHLVELSKSFKNVQLYNCKLEDYNGSKECDLTFTSIPYYDLEEYNNEFNYGSFEEWKDIFIEELLRYNNLVINLPATLQDELKFSYKEKLYLKNSVSHLNKNKQSKYELILKM